MSGLQASREWPDNKGGALPGSMSADTGGMLRLMKGMLEPPYPTAPQLNDPATAPAAAAASSQAAVAAPVLDGDSAAAHTRMAAHQRQPQATTDAVLRTESLSQSPAATCLAAVSPGQRGQEIDRRMGSLPSLASQLKPRRDFRAYSSHPNLKRTVKSSPEPFALSDRAAVAAAAAAEVDTAHHQLRQGVAAYGESVVSANLQTFRRTSPQPVNASASSKAHPEPADEQSQNGPASAAVAVHVESVCMPHSGDHQPATHLETAKVAGANLYLIKQTNQC